MENPLFKKRINIMQSFSKFPPFKTFKGDFRSQADAPAGNKFAIQQTHPLGDGKMHHQ